MEGQDIQGKKVLFVEDDAFLHNLIAEKLGTLSSKGVSVLTAKNADEARKIADAEHPDLILLDIVLPGKSGLDFLAELRGVEEFKKTKVIFISNLSADEDKARAQELGALKFFVKADLPLGSIVEDVENLLRAP